MGHARAGLPSWLIATFLLGATGGLLLLANYQLLPGIDRSWPLLVALGGVGILMWDAASYLVFGGSAIALGLLLYLSNAGHVAWTQDWPILLLVLAVLVAADHGLKRRHLAPH